tara:strand:+ start:2437 stop:2940 length:504 start_codon:yes stop_codon:yes gene_type:complete
MSSEIANQLKSQSLGDVLASTFNTVGGRVFPDLLASQSLADLVKVVDSYRATHAPLYGNPLPNTGTAYTAVGEGSEAIVDLIAPSDNEVVNVNAMSLKNAGGAAPVVVNVFVGATQVHTEAVAPGVTTTVTTVSGLSLSKGQSLTIQVASGTASDLTANASGVKSCF